MSQRPDHPLDNPWQERVPEDFLRSFDGLGHLPLSNLTQPDPGEPSPYGEVTRPEPSPLTAALEESTLSARNLSESRDRFRRRQRDSALPLGGVAVSGAAARMPGKQGGKTHRLRKQPGWPRREDNGEMTSYDQQGEQL